MNKLRIKVEPVGRIVEGSENNYIWSLEEFGPQTDLTYPQTDLTYLWGIRNNGPDEWRRAYNFDEKHNDGIYPIYKTFSGYCATKDEGLKRGRLAAKEYCRQREILEKNEEYIASNVIIEEISCQDLR